MIQNKYQLIVNLKSKGYTGAIPSVTANDNIVFDILVYDGATPFDLTGVSRFTLVSMRKDNISVIREGTLVNGVIEFVLGSSETLESGRVDATVQLYDANNKRVSSAPLVYNVVSDPSLNGSLPADDKTLVIANESLLTDAINKANNADTRISNIVAQAGNSNTEIVDSRQKADGTTYTTLHDRLNASDESLNGKAKQTDLDTTNTNLENVITEVEAARGTAPDLNGRITAAETSLAQKAQQTDVTKLQKKTWWIDPINDFGCVGDGITDDTTKFFQALAAAPIGGVIELPVGARIKITQQLPVINGYVTIMSRSDMHGAMDGNTYATGLIFQLPYGTNAFPVSGYKTTLKNLFVQEQGKANGCTFLNSNNYLQAENCQFYDWGTGINLTSGSWYSKFINCEWIDCSTGVILGSGVYNVHFITPKFSCDTAINIGNGCKPVSVFGGSIENFTSAGGVILSPNSQFNCYGTYWESSGGTGAVGIVGATTASMNLYGNYVYLANLNRWVNASSMSNVSISAHGNRFASATNSTANPVAYYVPNSGQLDISGDEFIEVPSGYGLYLGGSNFNVAGFKITPPTDSNYQPIQFQGNDLVCIAHTSAPSSPTKNGLYLADGVNWDPLVKSYGRAYFVLWSGSAWTPVS